MNYIGKFISNFKDFYNEINAATLTGAIDVVVVRQDDGSLVSSPFHVRFGKMGVLRSREKVVDIEINGEPVDIHMKLGETGEAFFVEELEDGVEVSPQLGTSPLLLSHLHDKIEQAAAAAATAVTPDPNTQQDDSCVPAENPPASGVVSKVAASVAVDEAGTTEGIQQTETGGNEEGSTSGERVEIVGGIVVVGKEETGMKTEYNQHTSSVATPEVKEQSNGENEIGVIRRVRKSEGKAVSQDMQTQTEKSFILTPTPAKKGKDTTATEGSSGETEKRTPSAPPSNNIESFKHNVSLPEGQGSKTDGEEIVRVTKGNRRKRKKRCYTKKQRPKSSGSQSSDTSTTSDAPDLNAIIPTAVPPPTQEGIFIMEDIESEKFGSRSSPATLHLAQSVSLPLLREASRDEGRSEEWEGSLARAVGPDMHPFSDTDISPPPSQSNSRPATPIKSDTEYEVERQRACADSAEGSSQTDDTKWQWVWGELPTPPPKTPTRSTPPSKNGGSSEHASGEKTGKTAKEEEDERSVLGSMLRFMRVTKKARHNPESEGIYLADLNLEELDPEVAALYFPRNFRAPEKTPAGVPIKDEDAESGNGPSLPQSPHSVEGAIGGPKVSSDSDFEDSRHPIFDYKGYHDVAFSLCGRLHEYEGDFPESLFLQSLVTYDDFCETPGLLQNPDLVVRLGGRYLNWHTAAPQLLALVLFQRPMPQKLVDELSKEHMPKKEVRKRSESRGYSWFSSWRRNNQEEDSQGVSASSNTSKTENVKTNSHSGSEACDPSMIEVTAAETQTSLPGTPKKQGVRGRKMGGLGQGGTDSSESEDLEEGKERRFSEERFKKSLRLSAEQLAKLNLREGRNEALFSVTTAYQGTTRCKCHIFLWNYDTSIVVSDIDGTITKSDVLGHLLPIIGKDWAQSGVAQLFTKIKNNGYNFLYLSARAIGQARITRDYLKSIKQGDISLPDGPLLLNPTSLVQAFHREVIEKKPEEFKISCLRDIQALYPPHRNPFYSGYGNKINDVWAYRAVGIPISRIFTINHRGELKHELTQTFQSSYSNLSDITNHMFPAVGQLEALSEYSSLQFWRTPMPDVTIEIEALLTEERCK
ncbi:hypothetical protein Pcinc_030987 [Petrolisthes cinctipes]|uniref:phosphatidate phosphatase n=1 Tax=Petrolisthes cinctipes TaxID=88211 RepID=A0AAE1K572_PETCI|nr:hypothetical protein Pcinc_030987 [Petrolisthes cinctipes]